MPLHPKQDLSLDENCRQEGGGQPQAMDEDGERLQLFQLMGSQEC